MSIIYQQMGDLDRAIDKQQASLQIEREIGNEEGQAISLHQLSTLYHMKEDYDAALAHSQQAEALFRKLGIDAHVSLPPFTSKASSSPNSTATKTPSSASAKV